MTASEQLWAKAEERANAPEHMRDVLALLIDQNTAAAMRSFNAEIGQQEMYGYGLPLEWQNSSYAEALHRYVQLKMALHRAHKYLYNDWLGLDQISSVELYCGRLREEVIDARNVVTQETWGDLKPCNERGCVRTKPHYHEFGRVRYF